MSHGGRHLSLASFEDYMRSGVTIDHPIDGEPRVTLIIDPVSPVVGLRAARHPKEEPPRLDLAHARVVTGLGEHGRYFELRITEPHLILDAYPVLCSIADRMQLGGQRFGAAIRDTLDPLERLLQRQPPLSRAREIGLCGELLLFIGLCGVVGAESALAAWHGPHGEEHDFVFDEFDVSVKTTSNERRTHWVDSLTQLQATDQRPLWLVSHQITEAGAGGWRLADLVAAARQAVSTAGLTQKLNRLLAGVGWTDVLSEMEARRWRRRFPSFGYLVDDKFPHLTAARLADAGIDTIRVPEVRYRLDLTDQPPGSSVPTILAGVIDTEVTA